MTTTLETMTRAQVRQYVTESRARLAARGAEMPTERVRWMTSILDALAAWAEDETDGRSVRDILAPLGAEPSGRA